MQHLQPLTHINNLPNFLMVRKWNEQKKVYENVLQKHITTKQAALLVQYAQSAKQVAEVYMYQLGDYIIYSTSADLVHYIETVKQYPVPPTIDESNINIIEQ